MEIRSVYKGLLGHKELLEQQGPLDHKGLLDLLELQGPLELQEHKDLLAPLDHKELFNTYN